MILRECIGVEPIHRFSIVITALKAAVATGPHTFPCQLIATGNDWIPNAASSISATLIAAVLVG